MKVLVVEDSEGVQCYLAMLLEQYGYSVVTANDGQQAWEILQQEKEINLVLTDWMMPNMTGLQLCETIRKANLSRYIYIILLTGKEGDLVLVQGMDAGADDFLTKPIIKNELRVRLNAGKRILNLEQTLAERNRRLEQAYQQIERNLKSAAKVQTDLLPKATQLGNIKFEWFFYPSYFLAGDIFNFFELGDKYLGFYQLDVSGNGISSALLSFSLYHHITNDPHQAGLLLRKGRNGFFPVVPEQVIYELNNRFLSSTDPMLYFTIVYGYIHKQTGKVRLAQAGHPNPVYFSSATKKAQMCDKGGFPVGMIAQMDYDSTSFTLKPGDRLFLYSDGVTECTDPNNALFSEERFLRLLEKIQHHPLRETLDQVGETLKEWRGGKLFDDDTTILAIEYVAT